METNLSSSSRDTYPAQPVFGIVDLETTGFMRRDLPLGHPEQPHVVQAGFVSFLKDGSVLGQTSLIVKPDGWTIPVEAQAKHGISTEMALAVGLSDAQVLTIIAAQIDSVDLLIGHNIPYDVDAASSHMIEASEKSFNHLHLRQAAERLRQVPTFCTMREGAAITNYPPSDRHGPEFMGKPKPPRLTALYEHLTGETMNGAHTAMGDVMGTKRVFEEMMNGGLIRSSALPFPIRSHLCSLDDEISSSSVLPRHEVALSM